MIGTDVWLIFEGEAPAMRRAPCRMTKEVERSSARIMRQSVVGRTRYTACRGACGQSQVKAVSVRHPGRVVEGDAADGSEAENHVRKVKEIAARTEASVPDQHVVSKVVLRRFSEPRASKGPRLSEFNLRFDKVYQRSPAEAGKAPDFVGWGATSAEALWKTVEDGLHDALDAAERKTIFDHPLYVATLKDAIALHFARSLQTWIIHERTWRQTKDNHRQRLLGQPEMLDQAFLDRFGLYPASLESRHLIVDAILSESEGLQRRGVLFRETVERIFLQAREFARSSGLEVAIPEAGEYIIGDIPALTLHEHARGAAGVLSGIALHDASSLILPIGRWRLIALGKEDHFVTVRPAAVHYLNRLQIQSASQRVFYHPKANMERFVRSVRESIQRPP